MPAARVIVLDAEAVSALAQRRKGMAERIAAALRGDHRVVIPSVVLAEVMTGAASDATIWAVLKRVPVVDIGAHTAARAGGLRESAGRERRKKRDLTVDAIVAAVAIDLAPAVVLTGDVGDFQLLTASTDVVVTSV